MLPALAVLECVRAHAALPLSEQLLFSFLSDVHNAEFVLTGVLTQTLDYESYPF